MGGFERIIPLSPEIDAETANSEELLQRYELYQQVASLQTSLHRSSKTHESRLAEVQKRKQEREEKREKLLRMMKRGQDNTTASSGSSRRPSSDLDTKRVIGASSRLYPGPGRRQPTAAVLEQQKRDREHHERFANLTKFPDVSKIKKRRRSKCSCNYHCALL